MRRSSTKTSNISSKRYSVVEIICLIENRVVGANGGVRFLTGSSYISVSAHARLKYAQNSLIVLSNRHNFSPFIRNRGRWTRWWGQFLHRKQKWRYFCACALRNPENIAKMYSDRRVIHLLQEICVAEANGEVRLTGSSSAHARWKYAQNSLIMLSDRQNLSPFMENRSRWTRLYLNQIKI